MRKAARSSRLSKPNNPFSIAVFLIVIVIGVLLITSRTSSHDSDAILLSHQDNNESQRQRQQFQLATHESLGFFHDIPDEDWLLYKRRAQEESWFTARAESQRNAPLPNSNEIQLWLLENVDPFFTCPHMRRVGGNGDGHKWVCDPHRLGTAPQMEDCLVYSVGSSGDYSFEDDLIRIVGARRCEIHVFDMEPNYQRPGDVEKNNIHYHAWGLKAPGQEMRGQEDGKEYYSFQEIMEKLGHSNRRLDVLKVDCEGCEFAASKDWLQSEIDIRQILMEFHAPNQPQADFYAFFNAFRDRGFALFSKEANTHPQNNWASGQYIEFSFVRLHKDFFTKM